MILKGIFVSANTCQRVTRPCFAIAFQAAGSRQLSDCWFLKVPAAKPTISIGIGATEIVHLDGSDYRLVLTDDPAAITALFIYEVSEILAHAVPIMRDADSGLLRSTDQHQ